MRCDDRIPRLSGASRDDLTESMRQAREGAVSTRTSPAAAAACRLSFEQSILVILLEQDAPACIVPKLVE